MLVVWREAWADYEFWNVTSKLVRSQVADLLNCSSPCRRRLEVEGEREGGKLFCVRLELSEAGQDIFLSISISSPCRRLNGGKCSCFVGRWFVIKPHFNRAHWLAVSLASCEINEVTYANWDQSGTASFIKSIDPWEEEKKQEAGRCLWGPQFVPTFCICYQLDSSCLNLCAVAFTRFVLSSSGQTETWRAKISSLP